MRHGITSCASLVFGLMVLLGSAGLSKPARADELHCYAPDNVLGPTGPSAWFPWHSSNTGFRYQALVPASVFGGRVLWIKSIAFAPDGGGELDASYCRIRFSHSSKSTLSLTFENNLESGTTVHYSGPFHWKATGIRWYDIGSKLPHPATSAFLYNGKDNMVVEVSWLPAPPYQYNTMKCLGTSLIPVVMHRHDYAAPVADGMPPYPSGVAKMRFTASEVILLASTPRVSIGNDVALMLYAPPDKGLPYQLGSSLGRGPIALGSRLIELSADPLLALSTSNQVPQLFGGYAGVLSGSTGSANARLRIPRIPELVGYVVCSAFVTIRAGQPFGIQSISNTAPVTIEA